MSLGCAGEGSNTVDAGFVNPPGGVTVMKWDGGKTITAVSYDFLNPESALFRKARMTSGVIQRLIPCCYWCFRNQPVCMS